MSFYPSLPASLFTQRLMQEKQVSPSHNQFLLGHIQTSAEISDSELTENSFAPLLGRASARGGHSIPQWIGKECRASVSSVTCDWVPWQGHLFGAKLQQSPRSVTI